MNRRSAFTLVELMVVIGIIGVLAALLLPQVMKGGQKAQTIKCINNLKNLYLALQDYASQNNGKLPWAGKGKAPWEHLQILVDKKIVKEPEVFICSTGTQNPAVKDAKGHFKLTADTCSYTCYDKPLNMNNAETDTILLADRDVKNYHKDGFCYVRLDNKAEHKMVEALPKGLIDASKFADAGEEGGEPADDTNTEEE